MTLESFQKGMAFYKSLGGKNLDEHTLQMWYGVLRGLKDRHWEQAVINVCQNEESLATLNFVAVIKREVKRIASAELMEASQPKLIQEEMVPRDEVLAFVKQFTEACKEK